MRPDTFVPLTVDDNIARLNWLAAQPVRVREELQMQCTLLGHEPTGEQFMLGHPLDVCRYCGETYPTVSLDGDTTN
jgi:hypothetical protein